MNDLAAAAVPAMKVVEMFETRGTVRASPRLVLDTTVPVLIGPRSRRDVIANHGTLAHCEPSGAVR